MWSKLRKRPEKEDIEKKKCPSYFGDYKCHVKTNVKDSKGGFVYVDKCLKKAVENLNAVGLKTIASCCGHGVINPKITIEGLNDGKPLDLEDSNYTLADIIKRAAPKDYRDICLSRDTRCDNLFDTKGLDCRICTVKKHLPDGFKED